MLTVDAAVAAVASEASEAAVAVRLVMAAEVMLAMAAAVILVMAAAVALMVKAAYRALWQWFRLAKQTSVAFQKRADLKRKTRCRNDR